MEATADTGSFRDRRARVYRFGGEIYRLLDETAYEHWRYLSSSKLFRDLEASGGIVKTEEIALDKVPAMSSAKGWVIALKHETIPFISYPYEWSFAQMKDAALFHLRLLEAALEEDIILKDSSAFNIQWRGTRPIFMDIGSFEQLKPGEIWVGYRQFCEMFLNPLFLSAYKGVPFQPWMRGRIDGLETRHLANLFTVRDLFRRGGFTHVYLHAKLQRSLESSGVSKSSIRKAGYDKKLILSNVLSLQRILRSLKPHLARSHWVEYNQAHSYGETDYEAKKDFVERVAAEGHWKFVWDLGCNTGDFSFIAADKGAYVVAMDADLEAVDVLYERAKTADGQNILPLVINLVDPSPSQGWRLQERQALESRGQPDLVLVLALLHHVVINANIPLPDFVEWLATLDAAIVLEFISKEDEMAKVLLQNKEDLYDDYTEGVLEDCLDLAFDIQRKMVLKSGLRTLYYVTPKR